MSIPCPMRIDAHQHFWVYRPEEFNWINESLGILKKNFLPEDLEKHLLQHNIDGCVSVQARQSEDETLFLLENARKFSFIKGVVGWADLLNPKVDEQLNKFLLHPKFCGVRHIVQDEPSGFMLKQQFQQGLKLLHEHGLTYDILIYPPQLPDAIKLCELFPDHKLVIDHLAKPHIKKKEIEPWAAQIKDIASNKNVYCKLSGLVTEGNWQGWSTDDFKPYLDIAFHAFGENRLLFGSDWPVCLLAAEYAEVLSLVEKYLAGRSEEVRSKIMGWNAVRFYNLE
jgi:L-fuconolactonase